MVVRSLGEITPAYLNNLDDLAPVLGFRGDEPGAVSGRTRQRRASHFSEPRLDPGIGEPAVDLSVEPFDNCRRRATCRSDTEKCALLEAWQEIANGR